MLERFKADQNEMVFVESISLEKISIPKMNVFTIDIFSLKRSSKTPYTKGEPDPVVWNLSGIDPPAASKE